MRLVDWPCPLCGASDARALIEARDTWAIREGTFAVVRCGSCGLVRTNPRPVDEEIASLYGDAYIFHQRARMEECAPDPAVRRARIEPFMPRARRLRDRAGTSGHLLDIGCGDGYFLGAMSCLGWTATGIEQDARTAEHARSLGHSVACASLGSIEAGEGLYDAVTLWGVLQLLPDPRSALRRIAATTRPGGLLAVGVSNYASLDRRLLRSRWWGLGLPRHLLHFEPATITALLQASGYSDIEVVPDAPRWAAFMNANTLLGIRSAPTRSIRLVRRAVADCLSLLDRAVARTPLAPVIEVYARSAGAP